MPTRGAIWKKELEYDFVYHFTNENTVCLNYLYNFDKSRVLSVLDSIEAPI